MENDSRSLIPFLQNSALTGHEELENGLTIDQARDLQNILRAYLKRNKVKASYLNLKAAVPVIKQCIEDGLEQEVQRREIEPQDDMNSAFRAGFTGREKVMKEAGRMVKLAYEDELEHSHLALEPDLVRVANAELKTPVFRLDMPHVERVASEGKVREGVFSSLVRLARIKTEELIPGSKNVNLTRDKQAGLVRNMLYSFMTNGEINPLIEVEDIIREREVFLARLNDFIILADFCDMSGIDYQSSREYLGDLAKQIQKALGEVPSGIRSIRSLNVAYKELGEVFAIGNPFSRLEQLSDKPHDLGRSIWDESRTRKIEVGDTIYRVPLSDTLALYAYMIQNEDPIKSNVLTQKTAPFVQKTLEDLEIPIEEVEEVKQIDKAIDEIRGRRVEIGEVRDNRDLPRFVTMDAERLGEYAQIQTNYMRRELEVFSIVRKYLDEERQIGIDMLRMHAEGEPLSEDEIPNLFRIHAAPVLAFSAIRLFQNLIASRIRASEVVFAFSNPHERYLDGSPMALVKYFERAKDTTLIDLLEQRSMKWVEDGRTNIQIDAYRSQEREKALDEAIHLRTIVDREQAIYFALSMMEKDSYSRARILINRGLGSDSKLSMERRRKKIDKFRAEPYAATRILYLAIARMLPSQFWPNSSLDFDNFLRGTNLTYRDRSFWSQIEFNNKLEKERYKKLRDVYMKALDSMGLTYDREKLTKLLEPQSVRSMVEYALVHSNFFGIERDFSNWCEWLKKKLEMQVAARPKILSERFTNFNPRYNTRLSSLEERRKTLIQEIEIERRDQFKRLVSQGLALPEEYFVNLASNSDLTNPEN